MQNTSYLNGFGRHAVTYGFDFSKTSQSGLVLDQTTNEWDKDSTRPDADGFDGGFFVEDEYKINGLFLRGPRRALQLLQARIEYRFPFAFRLQSNAGHHAEDDAL